MRHHIICDQSLRTAIDGGGVAAQLVTHHNITIQYNIIDFMHYNSLQAARQRHDGTVSAVKGLGLLAGKLVSVSHVVQ